MSSIQLLILVYLTCLSSSVPVTTALPITSIPLKSSPEHLTWDAAYEPKSPPSQYVVAKKITPKSIFITPNFNNLSVANCGMGWKLDATGQCIQIVTINQADILVSRLQSILSQTTKSNGDDYYDYEASEESTGPLQFDLFGLGVPQSLKGDNSQANQKIVIPLPPSTTSTTTTAVPTTSSTTDLFSSASERFEVTSEEHTSTVLSSTVSPTTPTSTATTTTTTMTTTTSTTTTQPTTLTSDPDEVTSNSQQLFLAHHASTNRTKVDTADLDAIATAVDQSTTTMNESTGSTLPTEYEESTDIFDVATPRVQPTDEAEDLAALNSSLNEDLKADFLMFDGTDETMLSTTMLSTTDFEQEDAPTTLMFEEELATETKPPPSLPPMRTSVVPVVSSTQRQNQNTVIVTPIRSSTLSLLPSPTPSSPTLTSNDVKKFEDSYQPLLKIENDTKQSEQLRVSVMNHETKANNMDRLESNNRFVYHHLESTASDVHTTTEKPAEIDNNTYERHHQLFPLGDPTEHKRNRIRFPDPPPAPQPFQPRSEMVRFPGAVASRQSATVATSTPVTLNHVTTDELDGRKIAPAVDAAPSAKPTWWLPTGWEVDRTTNSQKPLLLRFWSRMPLIRDPSLSFRNNDRDRNLRHRENSKSPRENFYKEIASQDIYKVFESNKHSRHYNHR